MAGNQAFLQGNNEIPTLRLKYSFQFFKSSGLMQIWEEKKLPSIH
jgi:hypothetical protein